MATAPGEITVVRMFQGFTSWRSPSEMTRTANLVAEYTAPPGRILWPVTAATEVSSVQAHPGGDAVQPRTQRRATLEPVAAAPRADDRTDETDIAQVAVFTTGDSNGDGKVDFGQSVEAGKIEYPGLNGGSYAPYLFIFFTTNMWGNDGDNVCGYNQTVKGWHQVSSTKAPGMKLTSSVDGGTQQELFVQVMQNSVGDWWVWVNDEWIGYYPNSIFSSTKGINDSAKFINWYGEVHDSSMAATTTDMGSGRFASTWWTHAAYIRAMRYSWSRTNWWWFLDTSNSLVVTDSACYSGSGPYSDGTSSQFWQNYFFYGGPGLSTAAPSCK